MNRRTFMKKLLGAGAAAVAGMSLPTDLRADDLAVLDDLRITFDWDPTTNTLRVTNPTKHGTDINAVIYGVAREKFEASHIVVNVDEQEQAWSWSA